MRRFPVRSYYILTKPGIVNGNLMHVFAGAMFASSIGHLQIVPIVGVVLGSIAMIASGCVINNIIDRGIDAKMTRTQHRPLVTGEISLRAAWVFALVLYVIAVVLLIVMTNWLTLVIGVISHLWYTLLYSYAKHHTAWSTWIGTVPGALPIVAGFTAVSGQLTLTAVLLGVMLMFWQLVHFYAIALFRRSEYAAAHVPVISVVKDEQLVVSRMQLWSLGYVVSVIAIALYGTLPTVAAWMLVVAACVWVVDVFRRSRSDMVKWGKTVFGTSLLLPIVLIVASLVSVVLA